MHKWLNAEKVYEGFPLFLRRPADLDKATLQPFFPMLATVTHTFSKRLPNGLPDPDYNEGLAGMDHELIASLDVDRMGVVALVETFGGKRHYYFYITTDADLNAALSPVANRYRQEKLAWTQRPDPQWGFIEMYAKERF